jgi:hypothetical protein
MSYRDEIAALRERNAALERELEAIRAKREHPPRSRAPRRFVRVAAVLAVFVVAVAIVFSTEHASSTVIAAPTASPAPPPSPAPRPTVPRSAGLAELARAKGGAMEPIARVFSAIVTRASSGAPVGEGEKCTIGVERAGDICFVSATCGAWSPFPSKAVTACTIDERGLPHGGIHMGPTTGQPTAITMEGTRFELADDREGRAYLVTMQLGDATAK